MAGPAERIANRCEVLRELLTREEEGCRAALDALIESVRVLQGDTADRRLGMLAHGLRALRERVHLLGPLAGREFLEPVLADAQQLSSAAEEGRAGALVKALLESEPTSVGAVAGALLDALLATTGARHGLVLLYRPDSTEAEVVAARAFCSTDLSAGEHAFSRSVLERVLRSGETVLLDDAARHPAFAGQTSVRELSLRSVLAVPLMHAGKTAGAVYLENRGLAAAFHAGDAALAADAARLASFVMRQARLFPAPPGLGPRLHLDAHRAPTDIVGASAPMRDLLAMVSRIADSPATVLIEGETGTGKELVARALHEKGIRSGRPFVAINCAAIPESLIESELFGHEKGAFTGATERFVGRFERADRGTIFLDEITELAPPLQAKLLRFLQSSEVDRLGGRESVRVDVRVVAAASQPLREMVEGGRFAEALFYRLNVIPLRIPPLRERAEDVPLLFAHFLERFGAIYGRAPRVDPELIERLSCYPFPGNVRELENLVHRLVALAPDDTIRIGDLPREVLAASVRGLPAAKLRRAPAADAPATLDEVRGRRRMLREMAAEDERRLAERVVAECGGNVTVAARRLGVHRVTLHKMLRRAPA